MFKSTFSKYLTALVIIIIVSFVILAGIITSMVRNYAFSDTEDRLEKESNIVVEIILADGVDPIEEEIYEVADAIEPMVNFNSDFDVMIIDANEKIILSTIHGGNSEKKIAVVDLKRGFGTFSISSFERRIDDDGDVNYVYNGTIGDNLEDQYMAIAKPVMRDGMIECYVMTMTSTDRENHFVQVTRRVVINSSIGVLLAALVAAYVITERIVHPLRKMTSAAKSFLARLPCPIRR